MDRIGPSSLRDGERRASRNTSPRRRVAGEEDSRIEPAERPEGRVATCRCHRRVPRPKGNQQSSSIVEPACSGGSTCTSIPALPAFSSQKVSTEPAALADRRIKPS